MLQTIYESETRIPSDWLRKILDAHTTMPSSVLGTGMSAELLAAAAAVSSSGGGEGSGGIGAGGSSGGITNNHSSGGSSSNGSMEEGQEEVQGGGGSWERDPEEWEQELQRELLLIQRQQYIQKQLLISEFHKQHQNLLRQHQAQLQEHIKLQQALLTLRQQQEVLAEERRQEAEEEREREEEREKELEREREQELHRMEREQRELQQREHQHLLLNQHRKKERSRETSAMASTEVRQKLHDFLLSKSAKDPSPNGTAHSVAHRPKIWYMATQHMSAEQSSPPLGETPPTFKSPLPSGLDGRTEDFPLRKTASEPNLKVRSRLKQKVAERRSGPIPRRRDGSVLVTPHKMRTLELNDSSANDSSPGSGPSSPIGYCGADNVTSYRPTAVQIERCLSQTGILKAEGSMALLNLYTSPSLPNLTLSLQSGASPICAATALKERAAEGMSRHSLGSVPPVSLETKVNNSHQALLQHLLLKDQIRQQKILSPVAGSVPVLPLSPLAVKERPTPPSSRAKLPRHHRPLNRTQSAPLPQSTLAQLVLQQQHQNFVEKQKQYQQQVHLSQILSQSIEHLRHPNTHLPEEEEEAGGGAVGGRGGGGGGMLEAHQPEYATLPSGGVIRHHSLCSRSSSSGSSSSGGAPTGSSRNSMETMEPCEAAHIAVKVKEEPASDSEEQMDDGVGRGGGGGVGGEEEEAQEEAERGCLREVKMEDMSASMAED
ncbi:histone deacetylase 9-B isoform X2 [Engraulis encrasicolus]|uniref:histone deacetylase 9-B isoform X2 n=1 Tax=Engraulis encrasicolus TaxID=184585 RepID=UPI002FD06BA0